MGIKSTITNAAEITILAPINNDYKTSGGEISVGACLVVASKGKPFQTMQVYGGNSSLQNQFGLPLSRKSAFMEGLRHVHDAAEECSYVNVIRVVSELTYRFPSLSFLVFNDLNTAWAANTNYAVGDIVSNNGSKWICVIPHTSQASFSPSSAAQTNWVQYTGPVKDNVNRYNATIAVGDGAWGVFYVVDGDTSVNRYMVISEIDAVNKRFTLSFYDKDELGNEYLLESHKVGVSEDDKDDLGLSAYIETVLERDSNIFRCDFDENMNWDDIVSSLQNLIGIKNAFIGGTAGDIPETSDFLRGCGILRNDRIDANLIFAAGIYDYTVLKELADIADERHVAFFYDVPPALKSAEAISWNETLVSALRNRHARAYHAPIAAIDQWRGGECVWGVSGAMAAAKARCNRIVTVGSTPGVHYSPAGEQRGYLSRLGTRLLFESDVVNRDKFYAARINPIVVSPLSGFVVDDDLTTSLLENYLRFGWINDILDYIDHRFILGARQIKFEPDGLTTQGLLDVTRTILDELVTSGALVPPRYPDRDGSDPYQVTVEQLEIDLWKVIWSICPTGAARRIVGQPILVK